MMKTIAIMRVDGGVSIMKVLAGRDTDRAVEEWKIHSAGEYVSHKEIAESEIPKDRTFRNAWKHDLTHDMEKCREIHKEHLRIARKPLLAALDVEYQRADETNNTALKEEIAAKKQVLRDATDDPRIAAAKTIADLKAVEISPNTPALKAKGQPQPQAQG